MNLIISYLLFGALWTTIQRTFLTAHTNRGLTALRSLIPKLAKRAGKEVPEIPYVRYNCESSWSTFVRNALIDTVIWPAPALCTVCFIAVIDLEKKV